MKLLFEDQTYKIIGCCFGVHKTLGKGFKEIVYKDALSVEFINNNIPFEREKQFKINYKGTILPHHYCADFILFNSVIMEVKAVESLSDDHIKQTLNYLAASNLKLALLINFGEDSLKHRRVIL